MKYDTIHANHKKYGETEKKGWTIREHGGPREP